MDHSGPLAAPSGRTRAGRGPDAGRTRAGMVPDAVADRTDGEPQDAWTTAISSHRVVQRAESMSRRMLHGAPVSPL